MGGRDTSARQDGLDVKQGYGVVEAIWDRESLEMTDIKRVFLLGGGGFKRLFKAWSTAIPGCVSFPGSISLCGRMCIAISGREYRRLHNRIISIIMIFWLLILLLYAHDSHHHIDMKDNSSSCKCNYCHYVGDAGGKFGVAVEVQKQ
jgi:hypothetical protein